MGKRQQPSLESGRRLPAEIWLQIAEGNSNVPRGPTGCSRDQAHPVLPDQPLHNCLIIFAAYSSEAVGRE